MALNVSEKQLQVLEVVRRFARERGYMPSLRELARELSLTYATVRQHLDALKRKGFASSDGTAHGLKLLPKGGEGPPDTSLEVPIVGTIAAGRPIEAFQTAPEPLAVPRHLVRPGSYALRVRGDSMIDDHILDGDFVLVEPVQTVENGTVSVVLLEDGTATLKRVYREAGRVRLQPANPSMKPLYARKVRIQGRVRGVIRWL